MLIFSIKPETEEVAELYKEKVGYNGDAGFDLYCTEDQIIHARSTNVEINFHIACEMSNTKKLQENHGVYSYLRSYYLYPRSSLGSKTTLRMCNSVGIIDSGYRGPIKAFVDNIGNKDFTIKKGDRWFQICSSNLKEMEVKLVKELSETERGEKGFGSTNKN